MPRYTRPADPALERARQAQRRPAFPSERQSNRVQDTYSAYDDFPWAEIEEYLRGKWPRWNFKPYRVNDKWLFEVPTRLTEEDRRELRNRRDAPKPAKLERRHSISPEPEDVQNSAS